MMTELTSACPANSDTGFAIKTSNYSQPTGLAKMAGVLHGDRNRDPRAWFA